MANTCPHRRLSDSRVIDPVGTVWKCTPCGALIPESAITIKAEAVNG